MGPWPRATFRMAALERPPGQWSNGNGLACYPKPVAPPRKGSFPSKASSHPRPRRPVPTSACSWRSFRPGGFGTRKRPHPAARAAAEAAGWSFPRFATPAGPRFGDDADVATDQKRRRSDRSEPGKRPRTEDGVDLVVECERLEAKVAALEELKARLREELRCTREDRRQAESQLRRRREEESWALKRMRDALSEASTARGASVDSMDAEAPEAPRQVIAQAVPPLSPVSADGPPDELDAGEGQPS